MKLILQKWLQKKNKLTDNQILEIRKALHNKYGNVGKKIKTIISKTNKKLKEVVFDEYGDFEYDKDHDTFYKDIISFDSYPYHYDLQGSEAAKSYDEMKKDLSKLISQLKIEFKELNLFFTDDEGKDLNEYISEMKKYVLNDNYAPSNIIYLCAVVKRSVFAKMIPSEADIKKNVEANLYKKYDEFVKFLKNPKELNTNIFWSGTLKNICQIIGMSFSTLNEIISKNNKSSGNFIVGEYAYEDQKYSKKVSDTIGKCLVIEIGEPYAVVYSISKHKIYYLNFEHNEFEEFSELPFDDNDLVDYVYDSDKKSSIKNLLKEYDSKKGYNIIK